MFLLVVCILFVLVLFFFFFQAEDGIRDYKVTGVQTCALPISHGRLSDGGGRGEPGSGAGDDQRRRRTRTRTGSHCRSSSTKPKGSSSVPIASQKSNSRQQVLQSHFRNPDRKSTRLNSSHLVISYAVFCL